MKALERFRYFATDAVDEWKHSPGVNLLATLTLSAILFVAGLVQLVAGNVERHLQSVRGSLPVEIYLRDTGDPRAVRELTRVVSDVEGVADVAHVDKEQALERFRALFPDLAAVPDEIGMNPLPASLEVTVAASAEPHSVVRRITDRVAGLPVVEEVRFDRPWLDRLDLMLIAAGIAGVVLGLVVLAVVVFLIASVLRLAVYARRDEIEIMMLVGATPGLVRGPFVLAGFVQGLAGGAAALGLVELVRVGVRSWASGQSFSLPAAMLDAPLDLRSSVTLVLVGAAVASLGAILAVRQHQRSAC